MGLGAQLDDVSVEDGGLATAEERFDTHKEKEKDEDGFPFFKLTAMSTNLLD